MIRRSRQVHPRSSTPLALRLSRHSLGAVVLTYIDVLLSWITILALSLYFVEQPQVSFLSTLRRAAASAWSPSALLDSAGQSPLYYLLALVAALIAVLLPVFLLGAFVFKLVRHDPITWRRVLTYEAHSTRQYVLSVRFYNHLTVNTFDLEVRAWLRWRPRSTPTLVRNERLSLLVEGERVVETMVFPLGKPKQPSTVRIISNRGWHLPKPGDTDQRLMIQGDLVDRQDAEVVIIIQGTTNTLAEKFQSVKTYALTDLQDEAFQDIDPSSEEVGWSNFEGTQATWVFVYGSLMRAKDLDDLGIDSVARVPATLNGWRRAWNVASDPADKDREYLVRTEGKRPFAGLILSLGLAPRGRTQGVLVKVDSKTLYEVDNREMDYVRTDVSRKIVVAAGREQPKNVRLYTYVPKDEASAAYQRVAYTKRLAVSASYVESVHAAARELSKACLDNLVEAGSPDSDHRLAGARILDLEIWERSDAHPWRDDRRTRAPRRPALRPVRPRRALQPGRGRSLRRRSD